MSLRHAVLASVMFTAILAGCNKRDEAPVTPPAVSDSSTPAPAASTPTPPAVTAPASPPPTDAGGSGDKKP